MSCLLCRANPAKFVEQDSSLQFCGKPCQLNYHDKIGLKTFGSKGGQPVLLRDDPDIIGLLSNEGEIFRIKKDQLRMFETLNAMELDNTDDPIPIDASSAALRFIIEHLNEEDNEPRKISSINPSETAVETFYVAHYLGYTDLLKSTKDSDRAILEVICDLPVKVYDKYYALFLKTYLPKIFAKVEITQLNLLEAIRMGNVNLLLLFHKTARFTQYLDTQQIMLEMITIDNAEIFEMYLTRLNPPYLLTLATKAAKLNCTEPLQVLLNSIMNDGFEDEYYIILKMIKYGNLKIVKLLFEQSLNSTTLLHYAVRYNRIHIIEFFLENLEKFLHPSITIRFGIQAAIEFNELDMFQRLIILDDFKNFDTIGRYIKKCCVYGRLSMLKEIVARWEERTYIISYVKKAFIIAASNGHLDIVSYLMEQFPNVDFDRERAIKKAIDNGYSEVENYLNTPMEPNVKRNKINKKV